MKVIFDLDGTLICSKKRLHELFCDLVKSRDLSFPSYWDLKFSGNSNQDILKNRFNYTADKINEFVSNWMRNIESDSYLGIDTLIYGAKAFLEEISQNNELYICTARQSVSQATKQLENLAISSYFQEVFVTEQRLTKEELLVNSGLQFNKQDWFIGDTGHDMTTGKKIGTKTCAVLSGFMSYPALASYSPDIIVSDITKFNFA
jgi:phosphoglycolate phosphatase